MIEDKRCAASKREFLPPVNARAPGRLSQHTVNIFVKFLAAGVAGFLIDATVFFGVLHLIGGGPGVSRISASCAAITVTWTINRSFAFRMARAETLWLEYLKYFGSSLLGAAANFLVVSVVARYDEPAYHIPAYLSGIAAGVIVNFTMYRKIVFTSAVDAKMTKGLDNDT